MAVLAWLGADAEGVAAVAVAVGGAEGGIYFGDGDARVVVEEIEVFDHESDDFVVVWEGEVTFDAILMTTYEKKEVIDVAGNTYAPPFLFDGFLKVL